MRRAYIRSKIRVCYFPVGYIITLLLIFPLLVITIFGDRGNDNVPRDNPKQIDKVWLYCNASREVLELDFEEYVACVTYAEMPASFEIEALKAQAVAARTYTYRKINEKSHEYGNMCDDINHCQAFRNSNDSKDFLKIKKAVEDTRGEIIVYNEEPINAVFHAASGGFTESAVDVWNGDIEYLVATKSGGEEEIMKDFVTKVSFNRKDFFEVLGMDKTNTNPVVNKRSKSGGVIEVRVGEKTFTGSEIRSLCGLRSTKFDMECNGDNIKFLVKGYGHGVGLSQWGAEAMARGGSTYDEIIKHYYKGVEISKADINMFSI